MAKSKKHSSLEERFIKETNKKGLKHEFEAEAFTYVLVSKYTPDFKIGEKTFVETKGYLDKSDRRKMIAFKEQHPDITVYLLFGNADNKIKKGSKTTYGKWADKEGYSWADIRGGIPTGWWSRPADANKKGGKKKG